jgi:tripartite-type tricarboxylate transporter receptor subunit TctC
MAAELSARVGQPVIVENRPGASAIIGAQAVAKAAPDGYTLLLGGTGPMAFNPALYANLPYSPTKDFAPISLIGSFPLILVGGMAGPPTLKELIAAARSRPNALSYGSSSAAFRLPTELFNAQVDAKMVHVPYKGTAEVLQAVMTGEVAMALVDPGPPSALIKSAKLRGLAVTSHRRIGDFSDIPTLEESGIKIHVELWSALFAPAGTPEPVITRLNEEVQRIVRQPAFQERLRSLTMTPGASTPAELANVMVADTKLWTQVASQNGIKAD